MAFVETLDALGSWELELAEETPDEVLAQLDAYGHVVIVGGPVDVAATGNALLPAARYVGVCRAKAKPGTNTRGGSGLLHWISDEDGKNHYIESLIPLTNATLAQVVTALLPPTVTVGTVFAQANPVTRYTGTHIFQSRSDALAIALAPFGAELRVNGNFTVDVGTPAQLYDTALPLTSKPSPMIVRKGAGSDLDLAAVGGKVETEGAVWDYSTRVLLLGQTVGVGDEPDTVFATGAADASSVPWKDPQGNALKLTRAISESGETTGSVAARAQLQLNRFSRETTAIKVTADDYEISGGFGIGDAAYVYDPDSGIVDAANQVMFRGQPINPQIIRVTSLTTPIVGGMTVAWRTDAGVWLDLTRWVVWESAGSREITVGDRPKTLTRPSDPIQDRVDAARGKPSTKTPKAPTGLVLSTSSAVNPKGTDAAVITATWDPVTQYTDNTTVALSHYEVQSRPAFRAPLWQAASVTASTSVDLPVVAALSYDVQVRAWSTGGVPSAWTSTAPITSAADSTAPAAPADPVLTQSLGQIRVRYVGTNNVGGAMPADANRVDVEVASAGSGGPFVAESSLNPFVEGIHRVGGTPGQTRWVRLRAYDHNGNGSAYSATVSAVIPQVADGEIASLSVGKLLAGIMSADVTISGRFTTALTGQRREMNAIGWQAFDAANALTVNIDGVSNLLTGLFQTALTGRRVVIGASGATGVINFFAPDGTKTEIGSFSSGGVEAIRFGVPTTGVSQFWNKHQIQSDGSTFSWSKFHRIIVGGEASAGSFQIGFATSKGSATVDTFPDTIRLDVAATSTTITSPAGTARLFIDNAGSIMNTAAGVTADWWEGSGHRRIYIPQTKEFSVQIQGPTSFYRFRVADTSSEFSFPNWANSRVAINSVTGANGSPTIGMVNNLNYGAQLLYFDNGSGSGGHLEITDAANTIYLPVWAGAYTTISTRADKTDITDLAPGRALEMVKKLRPRQYARRLGKAATRFDAVDPRPVDPTIPDAFGKTEIGWIGEEVREVAPELVAVDGRGRPGIDMYPTLVVQGTAIAELAGGLDALRGDLAAIRALLTPNGVKA